MILCKQIYVSFFKSEFLVFSFLFNSGTLEVGIEKQTILLTDYQNGSRYRQFRYLDI